MQKYTNICTYVNISIVCMSDVYHVSRVSLNHNAESTEASYAGMLCPVRDINKNGCRNRRKDSTQKFFMNSFTNGVSNSFYRTFRICTLLRNDSFRFSCQTRPEI